MDDQENDARSSAGTVYWEGAVTASEDGRRIGRGYLELTGYGERLRLPSKRFHRHIGLYAELPFDPDGNLLTRAQWDARRDEWLPGEADRAYVRSLMQPVREPGKIANWLGKPARGIKGLPFEYEYVRLD